MQNYVSLPDEVLVTKYLQENKAEALDCLLYRHKDKLLQSILFWGIPKNEAEGIAQETILKVIDSLNKGKYTSENKFFPWMLRIARNLMIDIKRRQKRGKEIIQEKYKYEIDTKQESLEDTIIGQFEEEDLKRKLEQCMGMLKPDQKEIVQLRIYEELSFREISEKLDISINTALGRMRYALINLRKIWESSVITD